MFFTINTNSAKYLTRFRIIGNAKRTIVFFPESTAEIKLNEYFLKNYNTSLKLMCINLIKNISMSYNNTGEILITFKTKKLDDIASIITYGNGIINGSDILKIAFGRN